MNEEKDSKDYPSLQKRLLWLTLLSVSICWFIAGIMSYIEARDELEELLDAHLVQAASILATHLTEEIEEIEEETTQNLHPYYQKVAFQYWKNGTELKLHSQSAPSEYLSPVQNGFSNHSTGGIEWRVYSVWNEKHKLLIQVGEQVDARQHVSWEMAYHQAIPLIISIPFLIIFLAFAIRKALNPLTVLTGKIEKCQPEKLDPLYLSRPPQEVLPLVLQINQLFEHVSLYLSNERRFTGDAAHELRTPVSAIRAHAQNAQLECPDNHSIAKIIEGCDRASHLIDQLLILARLDSKSNLVEGYCDIKEVIFDVVSDLAMSAHEKSIEIEFEDSTDNNPCIVHGSFSSLYILLRNIVDNACRYSPTNSKVIIYLAIRANSAAVKIADEGPGIPDELLESVMQRFYRIPGTVASGCGLGLSIVTKICEYAGINTTFSNRKDSTGLAVEFEVKLFKSGVFNE